MDRRTFVGSLAASLFAAPLATHAQQPAMPIVGFLNSATPELYQFNVAAFRQGLQEVGFVEGKNVANSQANGADQFPSQSNSDVSR